MQMFMGGPEPLEKEIHEILGSKRNSRGLRLLLLPGKGRAISYM